MNISLLVVMAGALFLFIPSTMWLGIAFLAIGAVTYTMVEKRPVAMAPGQPKYLPAWPQPVPQQRVGVNWSLRRPMGGQKNPVARAQDPLGQPDNGPKVENGMFSLPLPMSNDVAQFVDLKYRTPTKAKGFTEEMEKPPHPLIPGF